MKMVSSLYLQRKRLVRLRRWRWSHLFTCRGRGCWSWKEGWDEEGVHPLPAEEEDGEAKKKNEDGVRSLPAEEEAVEAEKMKMVSFLCMQRGGCWGWKEGWRWKWSPPLHAEQRLVRLWRRMEMKMVSSLYMQRRGWWDEKKNGDEDGLLSLSAVEEDVEAENKDEYEDGLLSLSAVEEDVEAENKDEYEDGLLSLSSVEEDVEAENKDEFEDGLLSLHAEKRMLRLRRRMKMNMVSSLYQ
jgi:hypothetical protein